jgi:hypothetical protein
MSCDGSDNGVFVECRIDEVLKLWRGDEELSAE